MAYKVFISYSTADLALVNVIKTLLSFSNASCQVFIAEYDVAPGTPLTQKIIEEIVAADLFLLLWSRNSKESEYVIQEIGVAKGRGKKILPLVIEPQLPLPAMITDLKYLPLFKDPNRALNTLQQDVFREATSKGNTEGLVLLGIAAVLLLTLSSK